MNRTKTLYKAGWTTTTLAFLSSASAALLSRHKLAATLGGLGMAAMTLTDVLRHQLVVGKVEETVRAATGQVVGPLRESATDHADHVGFRIDQAAARIRDETRTGLDAARAQSAAAHARTVDQVSRSTDALHDLRARSAVDAQALESLRADLRTRLESARKAGIEQTRQTRTLIEELPSAAGEYATLRRLLIDDTESMPQLGGWAITSSAVENLVRDVLAADGPVTVVELGSGASTLWLGHTLRHMGRGGHVFSLDHLPEFAGATRAELERRGLGEFVTVLDAPLIDIEIDGEQFAWYDDSCLPDAVQAIDLLIVDGPPAAGDRLVRYPALPRLAGRLAPQARVYLDDTIRREEQQTLARWIEENPGLGIQRRLPKTTILRWDTASPDAETSGR